MARSKRSLALPTLGSLNTIPAGGLDADPLRRLLAQIIAGAGGYGLAAKYILGCVSVLEDAA